MAESRHVTEKTFRQVTSASIGKPEAATPYPLIDINAFQHRAGVRYTYEEAKDAHHVMITRDPVELLTYGDATALILPDIINVDDLFIVCLSFVSINAPGRPIGLKSCTIETDKARYLIDFSCVVDESETNLGYETAVIGMGMKGLSMLRDIVDSVETRVRYEGSRLNMVFRMNAAQSEEIDRILKVYIEAGGTGQDLDKIDGKESISIKRSPKTRWL